MKGIILSSELTVREEPNSQSKVKFKIKQGKEVEIIEAFDVVKGGTTWYRIKEGYIAGTYVKLIDNTWEVTPSMTNTQIQDVFNHGGNIIIRAGIYRIKKTIVCKSNSNITFENHAVFIRCSDQPILTNYYTPYTTRYNGVTNVKIQGGVFIGNGCKKEGEVIAFFHANDIVFENFKIVDIVKSSAIKIIACSNITLQNFEIHSHSINRDAAYQEAIQFNFAEHSQHPRYPKSCSCYDGYHNKDIIIKNGSIQDYPIAIGMHAQTSTNSTHRNFIISDCCLKGVGKVRKHGTAIRLSNVINAVISNNNIQNFDRACEFTTPEYLININGENVQNIVGHSHGGCKNITFAKNMILSSNGTSKVSGIYFGSRIKRIQHGRITVENNKFYLKSNSNSRYTIHSNGMCDGLSLNNNITDIENSYFIK